MIQPALVSEVLGIKAGTIQALSLAIAKGLPKQALTRTATRIHPERRSAKALMGKVVPEATFKRRVRLTPAEGERTERLARVIAAAEYVMDDKELAHRWLNAAHLELGGLKPIDLALTELGARQVEAILDRIFYGIPA